MTREEVMETQPTVSKVRAGYLAVSGGKYLLKLGAMGSTEPEAGSAFQAMLERWARYDGFS
jgi:hypothetical protein